MMKSEPGAGRLSETHAGTNFGTAGKLTGRHRALFGVLAVLTVIWLLTWPARARMSREAARIERETAKQVQLQEALKQMSAAEAEARARVEQKPQDLAARLELADALMKLRKYPDAVEALRAAQAIDPHSARPHTALGDAYNAMDMPDMAVQELETALRCDPNDLRAISLLAFKYVSLGWNQQARDLLARAVARTPKDVHLQTALALTDFQTGDAAEAEQHLLVARRYAPDDQSVIGPLIEVYRHSQRYPEALKIVDQAAVTARDEGVRLFLLLERAQIYLEMENGAAALQAADQALRIAPDDTQTLYIHAQAEKRAGHTDIALRELEAVRAHDPRFEQTLLLLGQLYMQKGQREKGIALMQEYNRQRSVLDDVARDMLNVAQHPDNAGAHLQLGKYYRQSGNNARAIVELRRALQLRPADGEAQRLLEQALRQAGRDIEADALAAGRAQ